MFDKLRGVAPHQIDKAVAGFTEADWDHIEQNYLDVVGQLVTDFFAQPLGLDRDVDAVKLFCQFYSHSLTRYPGA